MVSSCHSSPEALQQLPGKARAAVVVHNVLSQQVLPLVLSWRQRLSLISLHSGENDSSYRGHECVPVDRFQKLKNDDDVARVPVFTLQTVFWRKRKHRSSVCFCSITWFWLFWLNIWVCACACYCVSAVLSSSSELELTKFIKYNGEIVSEKKKKACLIPTPFPISISVLVVCVLCFLSLYLGCSLTLSLKIKPF